MVDFAAASGSPAHADRATRVTSAGDGPPVVVYVETNFLLELACRQEESTACERLVRAASAGVIQLCVPAFSLVEARVAWRRQSVDVRRGAAPTAVRSRTQRRPAAPRRGVGRARRDCPAGGGGGSRAPRPCSRNRDAPIRRRPGLARAPGQGVSDTTVRDAAHGR
jgi:hypothetical protein